MIKKEIRVLIEAVAYLRISRDDSDYESSSITNQRAIISEWAEKNGFVITEWYIDENYSGYSMTRPDFNRLKNDLNNDKVNVIIAKDLSRIGRHNAKVNLFLENIEEVGKRVIAIGDQYDTLDKTSGTYLGVKTWMNETIVKTTSEKVRQSITKMQEEGRFISNVPYGYLLDPLVKGAYHINPTAAIYVKEAFELYLEGKGVRAIVQEFNKRGVPTHAQITKQRLEKMGRTYSRGNATLWHDRVIYDMLRNDFYIGTLTLRKSRRRTINGKQIKLDREDMIVFEDAHEPIIDKKTFMLVQEVMGERKKYNYRGQKKKDKKNTFSGKLFCADCGKRLTPASSRNNQRYVCVTYHLQGTDFCSSHAIQESTLKEGLMFFLEHCMANLSEAIKDLDVTIKKTQQPDMTNTIESLEGFLKKTERELEMLIEQKITETMKNLDMKDVVEKTFDNMIKNKYAEIKTLNTQINDLQNQSSHENDRKKELNNVMDIFEDIIEGNNITRKQVETILDKITVYEDGGIDIYLKGNLHELCTNYIQYKYARTSKLAYDFVEYCKKNPNNVMLRKAEAYVRLCGNQIGAKNFGKFFHSLIEQGYIEPNEGYKNGYRVVDMDKLIIDTQSDKVISDTPRVKYNIVTLELIDKICAWSRGLPQRSQGKKLF